MAYTTIDNPELYFQCKLYTGNGVSGTAITFDGSENMQPDFIWGSCRSHGDNHWMSDSVRGNTKAIFSNSTGTEETSSERIKSFDSNGFTIGDAGDTNTNTRTFVTWNSKAGGSASSNSNRDITSSVSVNTTAGISIVKYTGNGTGGSTIGHGLGSVPKSIWLKPLDRTDNWRVYHDKNTSAPETDHLKLQNTNTTADADDVWNDTAPTSTLFTVGANAGVVASGEEIIAYCFAEKKGFSKFGSYTGNGNVSGGFAYLGFRPSFVMVRDPNNAENWPIYDNKRPGFNVTNKHLFANDTAEETSSTANIMDFLSNGFKIRSTNNGLNRSGATFLYWAWAESPFVNSNGVPNNAR